MTMECLEKSPIINVGQTFVTKFGNITLVSVTDNKNGVIKVDPIGSYTPIIRSTTDYQLESFYDGLITVKSNFFTLAGNGAHFWVCGSVDPIPDPIPDPVPDPDPDPDPDPINNGLIYIFILIILIGIFGGLSN